MVAFEMENQSKSKDNISSVQFMFVFKVFFLSVIVFIFL